MGFRGSYGADHAKTTVLYSNWLQIIIERCTEATDEKLKTVTFLPL